jgi:hypothetical protein
MAKGLSRAANAARPRVPDAVLDFMLFSRRILKTLVFVSAASFIDSN